MLKTRGWDLFSGGMTILSVTLLIEDVADLLNASQTNWLLVFAGIGLGVTIGTIPHFVEKIDNQPTIAGFVVLLSAMLVIVLLWKPTTRIGLSSAWLMHSGIYFWSRIGRRKRLLQKDDLGESH